MSCCVVVESEIEGDHGSVQCWMGGMLGLCGKIRYEKIGMVCRVGVVCVGIVCVVVVLLLLSRNCCNCCRNCFDFVVVALLLHCCCYVDVVVLLWFCCGVVACVGVGVGVVSVGRFTTAVAHFQKLSTSCSVLLYLLAKPDGRFYELPAAFQSHPIASLILLDVWNLSLGGAGSLFSSPFSLQVYGAKLHSILS